MTSLFDREFRTDYARALSSFLLLEDETARQAAYDLGRRAMEAGAGILDLADLQMGLVQAESDAARAKCANAFFREVIAPFEMVVRSVKDANAALRRSNETLEARVEERTQDLLRAQKLDAVGRLAGGVAHDFNNMLSVIVGYAELLQVSASEEERRTCIEEILASSERAARLTRQLLTFSRNQPSDPKNINLNETVLDMKKMLRRLIPENIEMNFRLEKNLSEVRVDPAQVEQVLLNLSLNARDAMGDGGTLTIETANVDLEHDYSGTHLKTRSGAYVMLSVRDTGSGMDEETRDRIFEPFFTTKETGRGTGLGLAAVYGILQQNKGSIWVYSEPDRGSVFKTYFPAATGKSGHEKAETVKAAPRGVETILVAEDEPRIRRLIQIGLSRLGYRLLEGENGKQALEIDRDFDQDIHLLITDVVMPQMGGPELASLLRRRRPGLKVLFLSGYSDNGDPVKRAAGAGFLQKPFTMAALAQKVRELLDEVPGA